MAQKEPQTFVNRTAMMITKEDFNTFVSDLLVMWPSATHKSHINYANNLFDMIVAMARADLAAEVIKEVEGQ